MLGTIYHAHQRRDRGLAEQLIEFPFVNENNTADSPLKHSISF